MVFSTRTATLFISLILHSVLAWLLGPAGRGSYTVCVVFLTVVGCLTALGLNGAGNYFIASKRMSLSCGVSTLMLVGILCSVLGVLTGLGLIHSGISFFTRASNTAFLITLTWIPLQIYQLLLLPTLDAERAFGQSGICTIVQFLVQSVATIILVGVLKTRVEGAVAAGVLGSASSVFLACVYLRFGHGVKWVCPRLIDMWNLIHYGMRYSFAELTNLLHAQAGPLFLGMFASESEIGFFAVGLGLVTPGH